jgi:hypothetical protein
VNPRCTAITSVVRRVRGVPRIGRGFWQGPTHLLLQYKNASTRRMRLHTKVVILTDTRSVRPVAEVQVRRPAKTGFRPDIEGLRAVAVLAAVLFHADVPGVGGGYIGVDVFLRYLGLPHHRHAVARGEHGRHRAAAPLLRRSGPPTATGVWVTRTGAVDALCSAPHGAGRRFSRTEARKRFTADDLAERMRGIEYRPGEEWIDEIPDAYKDIDQVMADAADLVEVEHVLRQILNVKGQ